MKQFLLGITGKVHSSLLWYAAGLSNVLIGVMWLLPLIQLLISPVSDESMLEPNALSIPRLIFLLFGVYIVILLCLVCRFSWAKVPFLVIALFMTAIAILDNFAMLRITFAISGHQTVFTSPAHLWDVTGSLRWLLWFLANYWFYFRHPKAES